MAQNKYVIQVVVDRDLWQWVEEERGETDRSTWVRSLLQETRARTSVLPPAQLIFRAPDGTEHPLALDG